MGHNATESSGGKSVVQAALDDVKHIKQKTNRKEFMMCLLEITEAEYRNFMHGLSVWNEKASPTIDELDRLKGSIPLA